MRYAAFFIISLLAVMVVGCEAVFSREVGTASMTTPTLPPPDAFAYLFDDFNYEAHDDPTLSEHGWIVRTADGWPGVPGAVWRPENVTFVDDPDAEETEGEGNRLLQMTSSADGETTYQTQICQQRKFLEGTYATRLRFTDDPAAGPDGDQMVETFYLMSLRELETDPNFSELDFEYLPNGGWGFADSTFFMTSWETFQFEPWDADNTSDFYSDSYDGWHTLIIQIGGGEIRYFVDTILAAVHEDAYYPEVPMSINYNLWFIDGGQIESDDLREYVEQIDWVYFNTIPTLTPDEVEARVADFRADEVTFSDTVQPWNPPLDSPCDL